jgi:3'-phosphoadenosine 5'-phosphosulfate sulfotransferase (PAPS reductase)/FAD synthetase
VNAFVLFSGGHDSLCATHVAMTNGYAQEVVHVNTGIGIAQTTEFVRETCREHGWTLNELHPPFSYDDLCLRRGWTRTRDGGRHYGMPGPGMHPVTYRMLKGRALAKFARDRKPRRGAPFTYVTGVRQQESKVRMGTVVEIRHAPKLGWTWRSAIFDWSNSDKNSYIAENGLRRNEVVDVLHMSGECLCGAYAHPGERSEIAAWYPEADARISALESAVRDAGHLADIWGRRPPRVHRLQMRLDVDDELCSSCEQRAATVSSSHDLRS